MGQALCRERQGTLPLRQCRAAGAQLGKVLVRSLLDRAVFVLGLNVASMWGQVGASCEACYSATKGAVLALTKALAQELGPSGIRVNAVSPGVILTDMVKNVSAETLASLAEETPLEHNGSPEDIAQALLYLAQASFVTGQNLPVNGGFVL